MYHHMLRALAASLLPGLAIAHASSDARHDVSGGGDLTGQHSGAWAVMFHESLGMSYEEQAYALALELGLEYRGQVRGYTVLL